MAGQEGCFGKQDWPKAAAEPGDWWQAPPLQGWGSVKSLAELTTPLVQGGSLQHRAALVALSTAPGQETPESPQSLIWNPLPEKDRRIEPEEMKKEKENEP